jgi:Flp pilus assembly protein TadD
MLAIDPNSLHSLRVKATVLGAQGNWREAEAVLRRVIGMQPMEANRRSGLGQILMAESPSSGGSEELPNREAVR